ncbi:hypothetical protein FZC84_02035 [Rossellomorea vietnamensis]|uniref:Uncharacterized protein n=1 Tax=Rossellomorea vietnamensis TaxID=218284 RepID=A0A5D4MHR4_9BACI|nr:hypothetical protein [Rossellomorea vietnamensis]TYS01455.1 hypothetical protein FZC84_02035 [Rossellomorea vietnamensis]
MSWKYFHAIGITLMILYIPLKVMATSWAYSFVVWNDYVYVMTDEIVTDIEKEIGEVTVYSDMEELPGNFSNEYSAGTKYFSITNLSTNEAIAVEVQAGNYRKAVKEQKYLEREQVDENKTLSFSILLGLIILLPAGLYFAIKKVKSIS